MYSQNSKFQRRHKSSRKLSECFNKKVTLFDRLDSAALLSDLVREVFEVLFLLELLLLCNRLLHFGSHLDGLARFAIRNVERLGKFAKVFVDVHTLQAAAVGGQTLVQRYRITLEEKNYFNY